MTFWAQRSPLAARMGAWGTGLLVAISVGLLALGAACTRESNKPTPVWPTARPDAGPTMTSPWGMPPSVPPGPQGWWLLTQRLPQRDFRPVLAYFLLPADLDPDALPPTVEDLVPVPSWCPEPRGIRAVRLAPQGGRVAIFCWQTEEGEPATDRFWVWEPSRARMYLVAIRDRAPDVRETRALLLDNPLWDAEGQALFVRVADGHLAVVHIPQGWMDVLHPMRGVLMALDPQQRYMAESIVDEWRPDLGGSPKRYEIAHPYLLDLTTGTEMRWPIPPGVQALLPSDTVCQIASTLDAVAWAPGTGHQVLFVMECQARTDGRPGGLYVFLADRTLEQARLLWQRPGKGFVQALWAPHGQGVLLQSGDWDDQGLPVHGETVFVDLQGQVRYTWPDFPQTDLWIAAWGAP